MKPMGTIPRDFQVNPLQIGGRDAAHWVAVAGDTPLFVYDMAVVRDRIAWFRAAFSSVDLHYAIKANPFAPLLADGTVGRWPRCRLGRGVGAGAAGEAGRTHQLRRTGQA